MVPYRPAQYQVPAAQLGQLKVNDEPPSDVQLLQNIAVALATGAGSTITFLGISQQDGTVTTILKVLLGTALATISVSTFLFGFRLD